MNRNHEGAGKYTMTARSLEDVRNAGERIFGFVVKRLYFGNGNVIFNFEQVFISPLSFVGFTLNILDFPKSKINRKNDCHLGVSWRLIFHERNIFRNNKVCQTNTAKRALQSGCRMEKDKCYCRSETVSADHDSRANNGRAAIRRLAKTWIDVRR